MNIGIINGVLVHLGIRSAGQLVFAPRIPPGQAIFAGQRCVGFL